MVSGEVPGDDWHGMHVQLKDRLQKARRKVKKEGFSADDVVVPYALGGNPIFDPPESLGCGGPVKVIISF